MPFLSIIVIFLLTDVIISLGTLRNNYPQKPESKPPSNDLPNEPISDESDESEDESVDDPPVDGFSNTIEPFSSYYPY